MASKVIKFKNTWNGADSSKKLTRNEGSPETCMHATKFKNARAMQKRKKDERVRTSRCFECVAPLSDFLFRLFLVLKRFRGQG